MNGCEPCVALRLHSGDDRTNDEGLVVVATHLLSGQSVSGRRMQILQAAVSQAGGDGKNLMVVGDLKPRTRRFVACARSCSCRMQGMQVSHLVRKGIDSITACRDWEVGCDMTGRFLGRVCGPSRIWLVVGLCTLKEASSGCRITVAYWHMSIFAMHTARRRSRI